MSLRRRFRGLSLSATTRWTSRLGSLEALSAPGGDHVVLVEVGEGDGEKDRGRGRQAEAGRRDVRM